MSWQEALQLLVEVLVDDDDGLGRGRLIRTAAERGPQEALSDQMVEGG